MVIRKGQNYCDKVPLQERRKINLGLVTLSYCQDLPPWNSGTQAPSIPCLCYHLWFQNPPLPASRKEKEQSRKPLPCFLKVLTRNDTDHFCCYSVARTSLMATPGHQQGRVRKCSTWLSSTLNHNPTLEQHDFMVDNQPPQLEAGKMKENAQTRICAHTH